MVVVGPADVGDAGRHVDMPGQRMAADLDALTGSALDVQTRARLQAAQGGQAQGLGHHVKAGQTGRGPLGDRQADAVAGDTGPDRQLLVKTRREAQAQRVQPLARVDALDMGDALDNACEHQRPPCCAAKASGVKPSVRLPSAQRTTGRLMTLGSACISAAAEASSTTAARVASSSLRQVVPARLSSRSRPKAFSQAGSSSAGTPCFL
mmetsp:Transcript_15302/g.36373  ORF Transcript_15302/g.36373 Transcript_15302/m.36373 type:complete len:208 (+) Transcript_15302:2156-2779(+)